MKETFVTNNTKDHLYCVECALGSMQLCEVRDEWRKNKSYYEKLKRGPGTKTCMGIDGFACIKTIHSEIVTCGVAYVCCNGMCY